MTPANRARPSTMKTITRTRYQSAESAMKSSGRARYTLNVRSRTAPTPRGRSGGAGGGGAGGVVCTPRMVRGGSNRACLLGSCVGETDTALEPAERTGSPPVEVTEQAHRGGHDQGAHQSCVDGHRD